MDDVTFEPQVEALRTDRSAIIIMLSYVEAQLRRLGDEEAARHAAAALKELVDGERAPPQVECRMRERLPMPAPFN